MTQTPFRQVVTIGPDGILSGLERKRGQGIDLKSFGKASVERASHIVWREGDDADRGWIVEFLRGPRESTVLVPADLDGTGLTADGSHPEDGAALFEDYDAAVRCEIAVLDRDRLSGRF